MKIRPETSGPYLTAALLGVALALIVIGGISFSVEALAIRRETEIALATFAVRNREASILSARPRDTASPTVVIDSPLHGAILRPGSLLAIRVRAVDDNAVRGVRFAMDGVPLALDEVPPFAFEAYVPGERESSHEILVSAFDRAGNEAHARAAFSTGR